MLTKDPNITLPMRQSPDVKGVTIDFGGAPDHGWWRATVMRLRLERPSGGFRFIYWRRKYYDGFGGHLDSGFQRNLAEPYERVTHIKLIEWELKEE